MKTSWNLKTHNIIEARLDLEPCNDDDPRVALDAAGSSFLSGGITVEVFSREDALKMAQGLRDLAQALERAAAAT